MSFKKNILRREEEEEERKKERREKKIALTSTTSGKQKRKEEEKRKATFGFSRQATETKESSVSLSDARTLRSCCPLSSFLFLFSVSRLLSLAGRSEAGIVAFKCHKEFSSEREAWGREDLQKKKKSASKRR